MDVLFFDLLVDQRGEHRWWGVCTKGVLLLMTVFLSMRLIAFSQRSLDVNRQNCRLPSLFVENHYFRSINFSLFFTLERKFAKKRSQGTFLFSMLSFNCVSCSFYAKNILMLEMLLPLNESVAVKSMLSRVCIEVFERVGGKVLVFAFSFWLFLAFLWFDIIVVVVIIICDEGTR